MRFIKFFGLLILLSGVIVSTVFITLYIYKRNAKTVDDKIPSEDLKQIEFIYDPDEVMKITPDIYCVVLIIANFPSTDSLAGRNYPQCYERIMKYMTSDPRFYIIFIEFDPDIIVPCFHNHRLVFPSKTESVSNVYHKTILAMKFANVYFKYKYIIRTNLSSLWYWPRVYDQLKTFESNTFFGGDIIRDFISGNGMIMSSDIVQRHIDIYNPLEGDNFDDIMMGRQIATIHPQNRWIQIPYLRYDWDNLDTLNDYCHYYLEKGGDDEVLNTTVCDRIWGEDFQKTDIWGSVKPVTVKQ